MISNGYFLFNVMIYFFVIGIVVHHIIIWYQLFKIGTNVVLQFKKKHNCMKKSMILNHNYLKLKINCMYVLFTFHGFLYFFFDFLLFFDWFRKMNNKHNKIGIHMLILNFIHNSLNVVIKNFVQHLKCVYQV